jgi:hypothetical protein
MGLLPALSIMCACPVVFDSVFPAINVCVVNCFLLLNAKTSQALLMLLRSHGVCCFSISACARGVSQYCQTF